MATPLKCDLCSKPATVHLTQIVNNKVHKVDLCEECAQAKGVTDPADAQMRLGQAELAAGDKAAAISTFNKIKGDPKQEMVAHIWSLYARTGGTMHTAATADDKTAKGKKK